MTALRRSFPAMPIAAALMASAAQAETRASADLAFDGGYSTNLYLQDTGDTGTGTATFRLDPKVAITGPTSRIDLGGSVSETVYTRHYADTTNWSLHGGAEFLLSPLSTLGINANYSDEIASALNTDAIETLPSEPGSAPLPDPTAPNFAGQRRKALAGGASFQTSLSPRTSLSLSASATNLDYSMGSAAGYFTVGGSAGVTHAFREGFSGGASLSYSHSDYDAALYGSATYVSPQLTATMMLTPHTRLDVSAGATFSDSNGLVGGGKRTDFSGSLTLCRNGERGSGCINAVRSTGAAGQLGGSTNTAVGADYSYKLSPRSSLSAGLQYSASRAAVLGGNINTRYGTARAGYSRQLGERLTFSLRANYTKSFESVTTTAGNFFGGVSISYRLG